MKVGTSTVLTIIHVVLMVVEIRHLKIENFANKWQVPGFFKSSQICTCTHKHLQMLELVLNLFNNGGDEELDIPCLLPPLEK